MKRLLMGLFVLMFLVSIFGNIASAAPYPDSRVITKLTWDAEVIKLRDGAGDNWPMTWLEDGLQITAWGDGEGFQSRRAAPL